MTTSEQSKIALITGGATGIGKACCQALSSAGFKVGIHYNRSSAAAESLKSELPQAFTVGADISTTDGVEAIYKAVKAEGGLDVLVNNAGLSIDAPLFSAKVEDFDTVIATNMKSTWLLTKRLSRFMIKKKSGRIINISSVIGSTGNPTQSVYGMTKAAINNFTKTAALELSPYNILVNAIAPGFIKTRMTDELSSEIQENILSRIPLNRFGEPSDVAKVVRFLATEADYCTGTLIHVNGGMYCG